MNSSLVSTSGDVLFARFGHEIVQIEAWGADAVRVRAGQFSVPTNCEGALDAEPPGAGWNPDHVRVEIGEEGESGTLTNGDLVVSVRIDREAVVPEPHLVFIRRSTGEVLLEEGREHFNTPGARFYEGNRAEGYRIRQRFCAYENERLYGMGQRTHGRLDLKGLSLDLRQRNAEVNVPFVLSNRGYGLLWNNPALGEVSFSTNRTLWEMEGTDGIDYWICAGDSPKSIMETYSVVSGAVPLLPHWASGFWQSRLRYRSQEELLRVAREYRKRELPISVIVIDYFHWTAMGDFAFDSRQWPDPQEMVDELTEMGIELMVSVWPLVSPLSRHYQEYVEKGLLIGTGTGVHLHRTIQDKGMDVAMGVAFYDPTNPDTRKFVWKLIRENYVKFGIRSFWLDASEPQIGPDNPQNLMYHSGPGVQVSNVFPRENARLFYEGITHDGLGTPVLLSRSAWAGSQRYGAAVWSGDIPATWTSLQTQVRAGLNLAVSGIPWWTTDIGGFHGGDPDDPEYRELMVRWFQYGVFCPLFRLHGDREPRTPVSSEQSGGPNEVWSYGEKAYEIIKSQLFLRERLRPYIEVQMDVARRGLPPMRPLFVDFPCDDRSWTVEDQFMFGPDIMVAPILEPRARQRDVYLPEGSMWKHAWSGREHRGGAVVTIAAPLTEIPVFVRDGASVLEQLLGPTPTNRAEEVPS